MSRERRGRLLLQSWLAASCVQLSWGCNAGPIEGVQCGSDADCAMGSVCSNYVCSAVSASAPDTSSAPAPSLDVSSLLDDFEQPSGTPRDVRFGRWIPGVFSSEDCKQGQTGEVETALVDGRLDFSWKVSDNLDGVDCFPAVGVITEPFAARVDLSSYESVRFQIRYSRSDPACVPADQLSISFGCNPTLFHYVFPAKPDWTGLVVPWTELTQPDWALAPAVTIDDCIRRAETVQLAPIPNLRDGQCQAGVIALDSIAFEPTSAE